MVETMAERPDPAPHFFEEDELRHLFVREVRRSTRHQDFLSLCLVRLAHPEAPLPGLQAAIGRQIAEMLRATDIVGSIGSDIAVVLVHTADSDATLIAHRIREGIERSSRLTLRIGLAFFPADATSDTGLLARAQTRLEAEPGAD
jgi:hypothetical protein